MAFVIFDSPSTHYIAISRKYLGQAADNHISMLEDTNIVKVTNSFINDKQKFILICQSSQTAQVW